MPDGRTRQCDGSRRLNPTTLTLSRPQSLTLLDAQALSHRERVGASPYAFASRRPKPFSGFAFRRIQRRSPARVRAARTLVGFAGPSGVRDPRQGRRHP